MGCNSSSANPPKTVGIRRRLSVGEVQGGAEESQGEVEEDRGMITSLNQQTVLEILQSNDQGDRKFSIGSQTDQGKVSFANKSIQAAGEEVDPVANGLGYTCRKGLKPESPNQDSWSIVRVDGSFSLYGVYDGHGQKGHDVSNFVKETLPKLVVKDQRFKTDQMPEMLKDIFKKTQSLIVTMDRMKKISAQMSGTTATVVIHDHEKNKLTLSHVADSTAVLGKCIEKDGQKVYTAQVLTRDHKPDLPDERKRIEACGGRVVFDGYANHRVYAKNARYPGLNMSRCLGDLLGHADAGCSAEPETSTREVAPEDELLLVCSDGVWEFITPDQAVKLVADFGPKKAMLGAEKLAKEAWDRWIQEEGGAVVDDITVVAVYLKNNKRA